MRWGDEETKAFFRLMMKGVGDALFEVRHQIEDEGSKDGTRSELEELKERTGTVSMFLKKAREEWEEEGGDNVVWMGWKAWNWVFYVMKRGILRALWSGFHALTSGKFKEGAGELEEMAADLLAISKLLKNMEKGGEE